MIEAGDIHLADLGREQRWPVLVVSNRNFHRLAERALVAPAIEPEPGEVLFPWHLQAADSVFALDLLRSMASDRLLDQLGRASADEIAAARRILQQLV